MSWRASIPEDLNRALGDLITAAAQFAYFAHSYYKEVSPEGAEAYNRLCAENLAEPEVRIVLTKNEQRVSSGFTTTTDSKWNPTLTLNAAAPKGEAVKH